MSYIGNDLATDQIFLPDGVGAVSRTIPSKLKDTVSVKDFGAKGDGTTDDTAAFVAALATGKTVIGVLGDTYKITSGLTVNACIQSFIGYGSILDFSALSGSAIALTIQAVPPANGLNADLNYPGVISNKVDGWKILGPQKAGNARGTTVGIKPTAGHLSLRNVLVWGFGYGIEYGTNVYCTEFDSVNVGQCTIGLQIPSGGSNYGERLSFVNSVIYNNDLGVYNYCNTGTLQFTNCSIDYNTKTLESGNSAVTELHNCWWECKDALFPAGPAPGGVHATISDNSRLVVVGGHIQQAGTPEALLQNGFINSTGGYADFQNVFMYNMKNTANVLDNGTGVVRVEGTNSYSVGFLPSRIATSLNNKLSDPGFEDTSVLDLWHITADTAAITNRLTGTNIALSTVTTSPLSGSRCLKAAKPSGGVGSFGLLVPIKPGQRAAMTGWYKVASGRATVFISSAAALVLGLNSYGLPIVTKTQTFDTIGTDSSSAAWQSISTGMDRILPLWATHYYLSVNMATNAGDIFFDDFTVTTF